MTVLVYPESVTYQNPVETDTLMTASLTERVYLRVEGGTGRQILLTQRWFADRWNTVMLRTAV